MYIYIYTRRTRVLRTCLLSAARIGNRLRVKQFGKEDVKSSLARVKRG